MYGVDIGHTGQAIIFVVYGWTGGETNTKVAARTDDICSAILAEQLLYPGVPMCIAGDINCLPSSLPHLCQLLSPQFGWTDLGAIASVWGGTDHQGTCRAPNSDTYNRRDVMIVNAAFFGLIHSFYLEHDLFDVHATLTIEFNTQSDMGTKQNKMPKSMASQLEELFEGTLGEEVNQNSRDLKWTNFLNSFHSCVDKHMAQASARINEFCHDWNTNPAWCLWNSVLEEAFVDFAQIPTRMPNTIKVEANRTWSRLRCFKPVPAKPSILIRSSNRCIKSLTACKPKSRGLKPGLPGTLI